MHPIDATFVDIDFRLLSSFAEVARLKFESQATYPALVRAIPGADLVFCWFALGYAGVAAAAARALGRKSIVVSGGWDVEGIREIRYGMLLSERAALRACAVLTAANRVLAFSEYSERLVRRVAPRARATAAYLGVDTNAFRPSGKEDLVVTIANINRENLERKGLLWYVKAVRDIPEAKFVVAGRHVDNAIETLRAVAAPNTSFPGYLSEDELKALLGRAKVYAQPSYTEGFGVALAEAMSSGCFPVVTEAGAMPEVVGDTGLYIKYGDADGLAKAIRQGLRMGDGARARRRVEERFTLEKRRQTLQRVVGELLR